MSAAVAPFLLERDFELNSLGRALAAAVAGMGSVVSIVGPAGIGKSSLIEAARGKALERGLTWLSASGTESETRYPFGVVRQLFERHLRGLDAQTRSEALDGVATSTAALLAEGTPGGTDGPDAAYTVIHGLYWLTANLAQRGALVLAIDDMHWGDRASRDFVIYLSRRIAELPVLVITASRPGADEGGALNQSDEVRFNHSLTLSPAALSESAVTRLVARRFPDRDVAPLAMACHRATAGNPFFCNVLMGELGDEPTDSRDASRLVEETSRAAADLIVRKLHGLSPTAAALARAIAVLGADANLHRATTLARAAPDDAARAADELAARGFLRIGTVLEYEHPLVRAALHERIPAATRASMHRAAATLLRAEAVRADRIALHLLEAAPEGESWVVETLRSVARGVSTTDPRSAVALLDRALREPVQAESRAELLHELGIASLNARSAPAAIAHLQAAYDLQDAPREKAAVARDLSLALAALGRYAEATELLLRAVAALAEVDRDQALALQAELHQGALMDPAQYVRVRAQFAALDGEAIAGTTRGERAMLAALTTEACLRALPATKVLAWGSRTFERGLLRDLSAHASLWGNAAFPLIFADGFDIAEQVIDEALADARWRSSPIGAVRAYAIRSMLRLRQGRVLEAETDARAATDIGLEVKLHVALMPLSVLVEALTEKGELDAADSALVDAGSSGPIAERFLESWVLHARGWLRLAQARLREARTDFELLGARGEKGWWPWNPGIFCWRSGLAFALHREGSSNATALAEEELRCAREWGAPRAIGIALRTIGQIGGADGKDALHQSVDVLERSGARLEYARSLVALGVRLRRDGQRAESRGPLQQGMALAHECGAHALTTFARQELVAAGARPRRIAIVGVESLTASELRVARMAADGLTNREIAQALFLTLRTTEVHLTHAYAKLQISSRNELAGVLGRSK